MFSIEKTIDRFTISVDIKSPAVSLLDIDSGTGKSLFAKLLVKACDFSHVDSVLVNYTNFWKIEKQLSLVEESGIVVLDNAELYLDKLVGCLNNTKATVLVISRTLPLELIGMPTLCMQVSEYGISVKESI